MCTYRLRKVQYLEIELTHCASSLERKDNRADKKRKGIRKGRLGSGEFTQIEQNKKRENATKLMYLWRALMSVLETVFKSSQKLITRLLCSYRGSAPEKRREILRLRII